MWACRRLNARGVYIHHKREKRRMLALRASEEKRTKTARNYCGRGGAARDLSGVYVLRVLFTGTKKNRQSGQPWRRVILFILSNNSQVKIIRRLFYFPLLAFPKHCRKRALRCARYFPMNARFFPGAAPRATALHNSIDYVLS